jgi:hypothetical protein
MLKLLKSLVVDCFVAIWVLICSLCCIVFPRLTPKLKMPVTALPVDALTKYFRNPENYAQQNIEKLTADIGQWQSYDDWDWGRLIYEWHRQNFRVRVTAQSGCVNCVELLDASDKSRFGTMLETIWEQPVVSNPRQPAQTQTGRRKLYKS